MTLHAYFARRFLWLFGTTLLVFGIFQALLDFIEELRRFDDDVGVGQIARLTALKLPEGLYQIMPLVIILSAIALFLGLARSSEMVVARAAGRSGLAALVAPGVMALLIGVIAVSMGNPIVAATSKRYAELAENLRDGNASVLSIGRDGLWLRQGAPEGQSVIRARSTNADGSVLYDVTILTYDRDAGPQSRIIARSAALDDGHWQLRDVKLWPLVEGTNPESAAELHDSYRLTSSLTQDTIRDRFGKPSSVPIWELPGFIAELEEAGFSARRHVVWMHMELARPVFLLAMVLLAAGFTMRHPRLSKTGIAVLTAVLLGFGLYYVRNFAQILGENGQLAPALAAWVPPVASVLLALGLVLQREDG